MSLWSSLTDALSKPLSYLYGEGSAEDQGKALDAQIEAGDASKYGPSSSNYNPATWSKVQADLLSSATDASVAAGDKIAADNNASKTDFTSILKDLGILALVGAAVWAFFKFGGVAWLKSKSGRVKWLPWAIVAGVLILGWFIYNQVKKTATDTGDTFSNLTSDFKSVFGLNS
jgi:hypothetical protein